MTFNWIHMLLTLAIGGTIGFTFAMNLLQKYNQQIITTNTEILMKLTDAVLFDDKGPIKLGEE